MKRILIIIGAVLLTASMFSQSPEKLSYQAVIRDANDNLLTNQSVGMQISILHDSASGTAVYIETQTPTTNANGLLSIEIGGDDATIVSGTFSSIDWASSTYYLKTETDPSGGTGYTITGTSQILSVPYALYAEKAESAETAENVEWEDINNKPETLSDMGIENPVNFSIIYPSCKTLASFNNTFQKLDDLGTFTKLNDNTTLEVMFVGRIAAETLEGLAVYFELRIDNKATTNGHAQATVREEEVGLQGTNATIFGLFTGVSAGSHTVSMWVRTTSGSGTYARISPNCFSYVDKVIIKEYK